MKLHLIRHGLTEGLVKRWYYGRIDIPLIDEGREEILALKAQGIYPSCDSCDVYTSTLSRAIETCELIYGKVSRGMLAGFNEVDFGALEGMSYEEIMADARYSHFFDDFTEEKRFPDGGDSFSSFTVRVTSAFSDFVAKMERDAIIVCHGGTIARIRETYCPEKGKNSFDYATPPAHGITLELDGTRVIGCTEF